MSMSGLARTLAILDWTVSGTRNLSPCGRWWSSLAVAHAFMRAAATLLSLPLATPNTQASPRAATRHARVHAPLACSATIARTARGLWRQRRSRQGSSFALGDASVFPAARGSDTRVAAARTSACATSVARCFQPFEESGGGRRTPCVRHIRPLSTRETISKTNTKAITVCR